MTTGRLLFASPLLRRIQRHASFATLLRRALPPPTFPSTNRAAWSGAAIAAPVSYAQTTGVLHAWQDERSETPGPYFTANREQQSLAAAVAASQDDWGASAPLHQPPPIIQQQAAGQQTQAAIAAVTPPSPPPASIPLEALPSTVTAVPTPTTETALEQAWPRLQKIYRLHQEKGAVATSSSVATPPPAVQRPATQPTSIPDSGQQLVGDQPNPGGRRRATMSYITDRGTVPPVNRAQANLPVAPSSIMRTPEVPAALPPTSTMPDPALIAHPASEPGAMFSAASPADPLPEQGVRAQPTILSARLPPELPEAARPQQGDAFPEPAVTLTNSASVHDEKPESFSTAALAEVDPSVRQPSQQIHQVLQATQQQVAFEQLHPPANVDSGDVGVVQTQDTLSSDPSPGLLNSLPLEAVWPVQRQMSATTHALAGSDSGSELPPSMPIVDIPDEERRVIEQVLRQVATERPTASPVELALPRRPRPQNLPRLSPDIGATAAPAPDAVMASPYEPAANLDGNLADPAALPASQELPTAAVYKSADLVTTAIGALPGDLWQLIGEAPPPPSIVVPTIHAGREQAATTSGQNQPTNTPISALQRTHSSVMQPRVEPTASAEQTSGVVTGAAPAEQIFGSPNPRAWLAPVRQPEIDSAAVQTAEAPPLSRPVSSSSADQPFLQRQMDLSANAASESDGGIGQRAGNPAPPTAIDLDALAQEVYTQLKQRLAIERERIRR